MSDANDDYIKSLGLPPSETPETDAALRGVANRGDHSSAILALCRRLEIERNALKEESIYLKIAILAAMSEIRCFHGDALTPEERNLPRGSGWARVYNSLEQSIKK